MAKFDFDRFARRVETASEQRSMTGGPLPADLPAAAPLADQLESASGEAIEKAREILAMPLDPESEHFGVIMRAQTSSVATVLATQTRADENRLRATHRPDVLAELIERMAREELKLGHFASGGIETDGS